MIMAMPVKLIAVNCDARNSGRSVRVGLWIATILAIVGIIFERLEPMLSKH
jgi:hypothetical protein